MTDQALIAERLLSSLKGISGSGRLFGAASVAFKKLMLEPGDYAFGGLSPVKLAAPLAYDLWYINNDVNLVHHIDPHMDSEDYVDENLKFLEDKLNSLKPLKAMTVDALKNYAEVTGELARPPVVPNYGWVAQRGMPNQPLPDPDMDMDQLHAYVESLVAWAKANGDIQKAEQRDFRLVKDHWANEGAYFIQVMVFEMCQKGTAFAFDSNGPKGYSKENFVGHITFPVGQLGIMEVVSMFQETELEVDDFVLTDEEKPVSIEEPEMLPPMEHAGENRSFGKHLIESGYLVPDDVREVVELMASCVVKESDYTKDVAPKTWTRLWIKKDDKYPVPGEFVGILVKPLSVPPHVWWFQESTPFLYAGNWVETQNLTSGVVTMVTLEAARTDGGVGDEYWVKVNGIEFIAYASDFRQYAVDDRVAVLKRWTTIAGAERSFTWKDQRDGTHPEKNQVSLEFVIMPITFYKET